MATALFVSRDEIVKFTALNGNIDTDNFIQWVKVAQDIHIQSYLGTKLFKKINDDLVAGTLAGNYLSLSNVYIKPMLIHWSMVEYLPFAAYTISNKGVYKHNSETSDTVNKEEIDFLVEKERSIAENYSRRFIDYMSFNQSLYPEYNTNSNADVYPTKESDFTGWVL
jgi:hypothetical protein